MKTQKEIEVIAERVVENLIVGLDIDNENRADMTDIVVFSLTEQLNKDVLSLYTKNELTERDNLIIDECIEVGLIETDDIIDDWRGWVAKNHTCFSDDEDLYEYVMDFDEYYMNGFSHPQNWRDFLRFYSNLTSV